MEAKFTQGSIFKHVTTMTLASSIGLLSLFLVDLVDMYWLSLLGEVELAAAIGYAGSILFFTLSLALGLAIGCAAVVSHAIGAGSKAQTAQLVSHVFVGIIIITLPVMIAVYFCIETVLMWLGAKGRALELAAAYMRIIIPSMPILAVAMAASAVMRAMGNAKEAMYLTVLGGAVNAALDPVFIFGLGWGIEGAAVASVCARIAMLVYGVYRMAVTYDLFVFPHKVGFIEDIRHYAQTAIPAVLTNLSTPIGVAYLTAVMSQFGDSAVAGNAIIGKLQPLVFAGLFALSGAVGPIAGQNLGAQKYDRIQRTLWDSLAFIGLYCVIACAGLALLTPFIVSVFGVQGEAKVLIQVYCYGLSLVALFNGMTFVSNALFNNLKLAPWATGFNFAKATLFTMPFVSLGASWGGPVGAYWGLLVGSILIGILGIVVAYWKINALRPSAAPITGA